MPLGPPPPASRLRQLSGRRLAGEVLYRVFRSGRASPWWFASRPTTAPDQGGRFDLVSPEGTCYLATLPQGAALEAFQDFGRGVLPESELRARRLARVAVPGGAPEAADLVAPKARGAGVTAALWAGQDRALTQSWADALRRAGWQALWYGLQHDPAGQLRGVALFDFEGEHAPYGDETWKHTILRLDDDPAVVRALEEYGIEVIADPEPEVVALDDSGLL